MKSLKTLMAAGAVCFALPAFGQDLAATNAYVVPLASMENAAALYVTIMNPTKALVTLLGGASDAAEALTVYATISDAKGVPQLVQQPEGVVVTSTGGYALVPGGVFVALTGLKAPLKAGDVVKATLKFAEGAELPVEAVVK